MKASLALRHPLLTPLVVALTCAAFLCAHVWIGAASAAEWPTWPRPKAPAPESTQPPPAPTTQPAPAPGTAPPPSPAAKAGEKAGKKTAGGIKAGTIGWGVLIAAGIAGIAIALGGGGGGGGTTTNH